MKTTCYIGLDVHKKTIAHCIKTVTGELVDQGVVSADRASLRHWLDTTRPPPSLFSEVGRFVAPVMEQRHGNLAGLAVRRCCRPHQNVYPFYEFKH